MAKSSRRRARRIEQAPDIVPELGRRPEPVADPYAEYAQRAWDFAPAPVEGGQASEAALQGLVREWRRGRATRTLWQVLSDAYIAILSVVMIGAMATNVVIGSQAKAAACDTAACLNGRMLVPWGMYFALAALAVSVARLVGPVLASSAEGFWLLMAPVRRSPFLRMRLWSALGLAFAAAAIAMAAIVGVAGEPPAVIVAWTVAAALSVAGLVAWAAVEQSYERTVVLRVVQGLLAACAAGVFLLMVAVAGGWVALSPPDALGLAPYAFATAGAVLLVLAAVLARRRLEEFRSARLTSGGSLVAGLQGAMFGLDLGLMRDIIVDRRAIARGHVRPARGHWSGVWALVWRDAQRLIRFPQPLLGVAAAALTPYACEAVGLGLLAPWLSAIALMLALIPTLGALRVLSRTKGLARTLPFSTGSIRTALFVIPGVLAFVWALLVAPAFAGIVGGVGRDVLQASTVAVACGAAGLLGAVRWQTAKPVDFGVPMMATAAGAMPPTLALNLLRGFDVATLIVVPVLLNQDPIWSLGLALVVALFLRSGLNTDELTEQAKEQREQLDTERSKRPN
jgi:hypothetical protein